jgi:hypothetical protein
VIAPEAAGRRGPGRRRGSHAGQRRRPAAPGRARQPQELALTDQVSQRLPGPGDVAVHLGCHERLGHRGVGQGELQRPRAAPAAGVQAGVRPPAAPPATPPRRAFRGAGGRRSTGRTCRAEELDRAEVQSPGSLSRLCISRRCPGVPGIAGTDCASQSRGDAEPAGRKRTSSTQHASYPALKLIWFKGRSRRERTWLALGGYRRITPIVRRSRWSGGVDPITSVPIQTRWGVLLLGTWHWRASVLMGRGRVHHGWQS